MQFNKSLMTAALLAIGSLAAVSANAATTGSFNVKIKIISTCNVNADVGAQDINFGNVVAGTPEATVGAVTNTTALSVQCSTGTPYIVTLSPSSNNTDGTGTMAGPGTAIGYKLTSNAAGTTAWGNTGVVGAVGNSVSSTGTGVTSLNSHPVYATLTSSTDVAIGDYSDLVTVAVLY